jgi:hypothetical protein
MEETRRRSQGSQRISLDLEETIPCRKHSRRPKKVSAVIPQDHHAIEYNQLFLEN